MNFYQEITNYSRNGNIDDVVCDLINTPVLEKFIKLFSTFSYCPWIFSLMGSILVGLSGVFPLLIIPIEEGENLKFGEPMRMCQLYQGLDYALSVIDLLINKWLSNQR